MKIALVHDWMTSFAGGEQVLFALHELFPEAPIYTSIYDPKRMAAFADADIRTSYLQRIPTAKRRHQVLIPLMPQAFESFDLKEFDVIISSSTGVAKGVITQPGQTHICYMHTPPRYLWRLGGDNRTEGWLRSYMAHKMRVWDVVSSSRVDMFIANSETVAKRIEKIYCRTADVIYPPVNTAMFPLSDKPVSDYFLSVSRLVGYKRIDVIIDGCRRAGVKLKVVGDGPERTALEKRAAGAEVEFLGRVPDAQLADLYAGAKAFIFAAEEDFGIVPVEAMSAGRPVLAFGRGGLIESVKSGVTGEFFSEQNGESLAALLTEFDSSSYDPEKIHKHALAFDSAVFKEKIMKLVESIR